MDRIVYGPHCHHEECGYFECDHTGRIEHSCWNLETCPHCGPGSKAWPQVAASTAEWLIGAFGTLDLDELRALKGRFTEPMLNSAIKHAKVLAEHPITEQSESPSR